MTCDDSNAVAKLSLAYKDSRYFSGERFGRQAVVMPVFIYGIVATAALHVAGEKAHRREDDVASVERRAPRIRIAPS